MFRLECELQAAKDEVSYFQRWLYSSRQAGSNGESEEVAFLKRTIGNLSEAIEMEKAEVQRLKLQLTCEHQAVKDAEAESKILRKQQ